MCFRNESKIVLVFETFFQFFLSKKCQKQTLFRVALMGRHTKVTISTADSDGILALKRIWILKLSGFGFGWDFEIKLLDRIRI